MCDAHLIRHNSESVNITLFRRVTSIQTEACGVKQFGCHVPNCPNGGRSRATGIDSIWIRYNRYEPVVGEPRAEIAIYQDVFLGKSLSVRRSEN